MSSDAKANTLPKWSYILLAVLLGPFGVGLIWAIVSKGNVPDAVMMIASVCILTAIAPSPLKSTGGRRIADGANGLYGGPRRSRELDI